MNNSTPFSQEDKDYQAMSTVPLPPTTQLDLFDMSNVFVEPTQEYVLIKKHKTAILRNEFWISATDIFLCKKGDFITDLKDLAFETITKDNLLKLGFLIIIPKRCPVYKPKGINYPKSYKRKCYGREKKNPDRWTDEI